MRVALKISYDGLKFHGFARQPNQNTVEGQILDILNEDKIIKNHKDAVFRYASRTDKFVSSLGNVMAFNTEVPIYQILSKFNKTFDIIPYAFKKVDNSFFPRYANLRWYRYYLKNDEYDLESILSTTSYFIGAHDFSNFARIEKNKNPKRTIENIVINSNDNFFIIDFYAKTYLWNQIRRIISAIIKVEQNKITRDDINFALKNPHHKVDFGLASAEPLILQDIIYDFNFRIDMKQLQKVNNLKKKIISRLI